MNELFDTKLVPPFVVVDGLASVPRPDKLDRMAKSLGGQLAETDEVNGWNRYHYQFPTVAKAKKFRAAVSAAALRFRAVILVQ